MKDRQEELLTLLRKVIIPATGCTEPIAVAYAVAKAREQTTGNLEHIQVQVDSNIYKNGLKVTIPGTTEKGLIFAAAFGFLVGKTEKGFCVIEGLTNENIREARDLVEQKKIALILNRNYKGLHIEINLVTNQDKVRVIILDSHLNVASVEKIDKDKYFMPFIKRKSENSNVLNNKIQKYKLEDFLQFVTNVSLEELLFLDEGVKMNLAIAKEGLTLKSGVGSTLTKLIGEGTMSDNMITRAQVLCASASEARMSGSSLPVMSTTGSGNQGITAFLTNYAVAEKKNVSKKKLIYSLALTHLITLFIKSYIGTLSAMCGCGVAAGMGASAGVAYLLNGNKEQIMGALYNMVGSISGIICDGAKEGCAYKLALASGWAVQSALLSLKGAVIHKTDGIVSPDFRQLFKNLAYLCDPGMIATDQTILDVMLW